MKKRTLEKILSLLYQSLAIFMALGSGILMKAQKGGSDELFFVSLVFGIGAVTYAGFFDK